MTTLHIMLIVQFVISNFLIFGTVYLLHSGFKNKKLLRFQYWISPLKSTSDSDKMYNYIITMYDAGVLTCSLGTDGLLRFTEENSEDPENTSSIELYCMFPYYGAFNIKKFRDSNKPINAKPNFELFKRLVDIHSECTPKDAAVIKLD